MSLDRLRLVIKSQNNPIEGYWYLRKKDLTKLTSKNPLTKEFFGNDFKEPEEAVKAFYDQYIHYLSHQFWTAMDKLKEVQESDPPKNGFRPGWLSKMKTQAEQQKNGVINKGNESLVNVIMLLRQKGWPTPPRPTLPWDILGARRSYSPISRERKDLSSESPSINKTEMAGVSKDNEEVQSSKEEVHPADWSKASFVKTKT
jgi:hypothetical protein